MVNRIRMVGLPATVLAEELDSYVFSNTHTEWGEVPDCYHYFDMQEKIWNQLSDGFSMECFVRPSWSEAEQPARWCSLLGYQQSGGFGMVVGSDGRWMFQPHIGGRYVNLKSDARALRDRWTHLVGVWDRQAAKAWLYIDGKLAAQADCPGEMKLPDSPHRLCFLGCDLCGADGTAEAAFRGQIATLRLYRDPLSASQVATLFRTSANLAPR